MFAATEPHQAPPPWRDKPVCHILIQASNEVFDHRRNLGTLWETKVLEQRGEQIIYFELSPPVEFFVIRQVIVIGTPEDL